MVVSAKPEMGVLWMSRKDTHTHTHPREDAKGASHTSPVTVCGLPEFGEQICFLEKLFLPMLGSSLFLDKCWLVVGQWG